MAKTSGLRLYAFTIPGLERIAAAEARQRLAKVRIEGERPGRVLFTHRGDPRPVLELGTVEDVFALIGQGPVSGEQEGLEQALAMVRDSSLWEAALGAHHLLRPRQVHRVTFRVVTQRPHGEHTYTRRALQKWVIEGIEARFPRWHWVAENALLEVWVLQDGDEFLCGVRLSDRTMRHRKYKQVSVEASLRPVVARAMVVLSEPRDSDLFLDPMCGAGTILIERGEHGRYGQLLGGDIDPQAVAAARTNVGPRYQPIEIREWDATALPLPDASVTRVVCNLPFGHKIGSAKILPGLYRGFLAETVRVLRPGGIAVLLTGERGVLERVSKACPVLRPDGVVPVVVLGRGAYIMTFRRTP
ncbi:MAG: methyltransferase domain-containing protein [Candidatus Latescibacterota bacterium]|jgi:23S rRNA G2445 N2-methylase RlmL